MLSVLIQQKAVIAKRLEHIDNMKLFNEEKLKLANKKY
jgi:hypothetical protein